MSRTARRRSYGCHRSPATRNTQVGETRSAENLEQEGLPVSNRHAARSNQASGKIVNSWDDLGVAGREEAYQGACG